MCIRDSVWDPRIHAKLYHSAEQNRKLGGFTLSQTKAIQRARKEHENFRAEFESILRGIEGSMEAANPVSYTHLPISKSPPNNSFSR